MGITTVIKRLLGVEDVNWDDDGSDSRFPVETSTGGMRSVKRINSSDIPSTKVTRTKERIGSSTPVTGGKDVDGHLQEIYDDLAKIGEPDGTTLQELDGVLKVVALGTDSVDTDEIAAGAVGTEALEDGAVTTPKLDDTEGAEAVTGDVIRSLAVDTVHLALNAVKGPQISANVVTPGKLGMDGGTGTFSHYMVAAGTIQMLAGDVERHFPVSDVVATDIVMCVMKYTSDSTAYLQYAYMGPSGGSIYLKTSNLDVTSTVQYMIFRACVT